MTTYLEKLPACQATMRVELEADAVRAERRRVVDTFALQAKIPGFRPGKIPKDVVEKRFKKAIEDELRDRLVRLGCKDGIAKEGVNVITVTDIDDVELHDDDSFTFVVKMQTAPEVELPDYRGIPVSVPRLEVSDHDIEHEMEHIRMGLGDYDTIKDRALQDGDSGVVDFKTELDGVPVGDVIPEASGLSSVENSWLPIGENVLFPGFGAHLVGQNIGEIREFDLTVPEDFKQAALAGKTLHFTVTLLEIKVRKVPEWTDELANSLTGGNGGLPELKERLRERAEQAQAEERRRDLTTQIIEHLDNQTTFELPAAVVVRETQRQVNQIVRRSQMQGASDGDMMEHKDAIIRHASTQAEVNVKASFILRQIAEKEAIKAEENEILGYCAQQAREAGVSLKKFVSQLRKADMLDEVVDSIVRIKTLDLLREHANITETDRAPHQCDLPGHQTETV